MNALFTPSNTHSWLRLLGDPPGATCVHGIRIMYGVLRPDCQGYAISAAAFARAKLAVPARPDPDDWDVTAHRAEVLLPSHADDRLLSPRTLFEEVDATLPPNGRALATYITLSWTPSRLHAQFEFGRAVARKLTAMDLAVLLVQHVPSHALRTNPPHLHLLAVTRRIMPFGSFGPPVPLLGRDRGRQMIVDIVAELAAEMNP